MRIKHLFHGHKDVGGQSSAAVYGVVGDSVYFAVEPVFCIAVWKHEIFALEVTVKRIRWPALNVLDSFVVECALHRLDPVP